MEVGENLEGLVEEKNMIKIHLNLKLLSIIKIKYNNKNAFRQMLFKCHYL